MGDSEIHILYICSLVYPGAYYCNEIYEANYTFRRLGSTIVSEVPPELTNQVKNSSTIELVSDNDLVSGGNFTTDVAQHGVNVAGMSEISPKTPSKTIKEEKVSGMTSKTPKIPKGEVLASPKLRNSKISPLVLGVDLANRVSQDNTTITTEFVEGNTTIGSDVNTGEATVTTREISLQSMDSVMAGTEISPKALGKPKQSATVGTKRAASNSFSAPEGSQSKDVLMAELKAMKIVSCACVLKNDFVSDQSIQASITSRNAALEAEIAGKRAKLEEVSKDLQ